MRYTEELNKQRKRELEAIKAEELRKIRIAMGLDPDHVSEFKMELTNLLVKVR